MSIGAGSNRPPSSLPTGSRNQGARDPDSSDSDSGSSDKEAKGSRSLKTSKDKLFAALLCSLKCEKPRPEAPKLKTYKGDPEDLERFIQSLENVWAIEKRKYKDNLIKICFTTNLLERPISSKHRNPVQWYEAYHPKIDLAAARRLPGGQRAVIDPIWSTWDVFVAALRSSFGTKVGKEQAVTQWLNLQHTNSIDEYLDSLTNLMWQTGYPGDIAKDKLVRELNREVGLAWA